MKHETVTTHSFLSDDGKLGIVVEMEGGKVVVVTLTKKGGPKAELKSVDLPQLVEVSKAANDFLDKLTSSEMALG